LLPLIEKDYGYRKPEALYYYSDTYPDK
jgi:hypothetical protein